MEKLSQLLIILLASITLSHCAFSGNNSWDSQVSGPQEMPDEIRHLVQQLITNSKQAGNITAKNSYRKPAYSLQQCVISIE